MRLLLLGLSHMDLTSNETQVAKCVSYFLWKVIATAEFEENQKEKRNISHNSSKITLPPDSVKSHGHYSQLYNIPKESFQSAEYPWKSKSLNYPLLGAKTWWKLATNVEVKKETLHNSEEYQELDALNTQRSSRKSKFQFCKKYDLRLLAN